MAVVLAGFGADTSTSSHDVRLAGPPPPPAPKRVVAKVHAVSTASPRAPDTPAVRQLAVALSRGLADAGPSTGALVYDLSSHQALFLSRAAIGRAPASVEKLYTTVAVLRRLGPGARLQTAILGTGQLRHGVWHGDLYVRGGGDPTFGDTGFNQVWNHGYGSNPNQLVAQLHRRGIRRVTGQVFADESLFDRGRGGLSTGYAPDVPDYGGQLSALDYDHGTSLRRLSPAVFADRQVVAFMRLGGIQATAARTERRTPKQAHLLAVVHSPPMGVMTRLMDVPSDDLFAELFTKQLGVRFDGRGSISAGARVIRETIAGAYGLRPTILDGSGLSHRDRSSPVQIVDLLRELWGTPVGGRLAASLPTVGVSGTVQGIGARTAARGRCVAKTGTLDYVTNLAGYCRARGRHTLAFAIMLDGPSNAASSVIEGRMIGAIARY